MPKSWVTIPQAAEALGVSASTIRRRIARSMLDARVETNGKKLVHIPTNLVRDTPATQPDEPQPATETHIEDASPEELIERLYDPDAAHNFAPGDLLAGTAPADIPETHRYQRLAGAAVVLAQRQTDEAYDKVRILAEQNRRLRKLCFTSWAIFAGLLSLTLLMTWSSSSAAGSAEQETLTLRQKLTETQSELDHLQNQLQPTNSPWEQTPRNRHSLSEVPTR